MDVPKRAFFWSELTTKEFGALDPEKNIAIRPVAATEQHGPHQPVMTDTAIAEGMIALLKEPMLPDLRVLVLPVPAIGKSNEHLLSPVQMDQAKNFESVAIEKEFRYLSPAGTHAFGWIAQGLNPDGSVGNAPLGTAEKGSRTAAHQIDSFIGLLRDMTEFRLSRLHAARNRSEVRLSSC